MRFIHMSDLHIGKITESYSMFQQEKKLNEIILYIKEVNPDLVIIAGDLIDRNANLNESILVLNDFFAELKKMNNIHIIAIKGNNDKEFNFDLIKNDIFFIESYSDKNAKIILNDKYGVINIYSIPFISKYELLEYPSHVSSYEDMLNDIIIKNKINYNDRNILICHQRVVDNKSCFDDEFCIYYKIFDKFDYVALGHEHDENTIGKETIRYSGSILRYYNKENKNKIVNLVTIKEKSNIDIYKHLLLE